MRYFDRHRKRLTKHHYIRGTLKSAEGENEVKIEDSAGVPFNKVEIAGNTSQKQYQGYQLFQFKDYSTSLTDTDGNVLTWEMKDGVVTINGIQNEFSFVTLDSKCVTSSTLEAGTYSYTASYYRDANSSIGGCDWRFRYSSDTTTIGIGSYTHGTNKTVETKTFDEPFYFRYAQFYLVANKEYKDFKFTIGLFKGSYTGETMPPYEPYVGGIPSPNPGQKIPIYSTTESTMTLNTELEASEITYDSNFLYTIAFEHPFSFNGAESLTLSVDSFYTGSAGDMLIVGGDPSNIIGGSGTFDYIATGDGSRGEVTIHSSGYGDTFYIGIGNTDTGISSDKIEEYRQLAITTTITATGTITTQTGVREIPAYPQEIENANSEGASVILQGYNLLNKEEFTSSALRNETAYRGYGNDCLNTQTVQNIIKKGVTYTISYDVEGIEDLTNVESVPNGCGFMFWDKNLKRSVWSRCSRYPKLKGEIIHYHYTFKIPTDFEGLRMLVYEYRLTINGVTSAKGCIIRNVQIVEGAEEKPFQPYFREEIAIPASVEVEGATVDLRFAKQGNKADKLTVNRLNRKVTYEQRVKTEPLPITSATWGIPTTANQVKTLRATTYFYNSFSNIRIGEGFLMNKFKEVFDITLDEQGFYMATGGLLGWVGIRVNRDLLETQDSAGIKKWLQTQQDEGDPVLVNYALATPITHDITSTELGQALLRLCVDRGLDGTLRVESELGISSLSCDYYSQENEDKVLLTVSYQNEAGDALMNDKTHNVRRGSKYQIVSPQIDGYEPSEKEVFGIADGDLTIILKYKEVSDVTV